jgi:death on curing protein
LLLHSESLAEHGGMTGLRDRALLESAVARPQQIQAYEQKADLARLAAAYCFGLIRNHPFNDGNKRIGFLAVGLFLGINGRELVADQVEAVQTILKVAAGEMREPALTAWIRKHTRKLKASS